MIKQERAIGLQAAFDVAGQFFEGYVEDYIRCKEMLPNWGPDVDEAVSEYLTGLECWVRGGIEWSLTCPRYFGRSVEEVRATRRVALAKRVI